MRKVDVDRRNKIHHDHPLLYPHAISFECHDGWLDLLDSLSNDLEVMIRKWIDNFRDSADYDPDFVPSCIQIKEKYGALRFYMTLATDEMYFRIEKAETESRVTCEICGKKGELKTESGWCMVRCEECPE